MARLGNPAAWRDFDGQEVSRRGAGKASDPRGVGAGGIAAAEPASSRQPQAEREEGVKAPVKRKLTGSQDGEVCPHGVRA